MHPLVQIIFDLGWVVGPLYDKNQLTKPWKAIGYRAVKGWNVINLDDDAEELVTLRAATPTELYALVLAYDAEEERKLTDATKPT